MTDTIHYFLNNIPSGNSSAIMAFGNFTTLSADASLLLSDKRTVGIASWVPETVVD